MITNNQTNKTIKIFLFALSFSGVVYAQTPPQATTLPANRPSLPNLPLSSDTTYQGGYVSYPSAPVPSTAQMPVPAASAPVNKPYVPAPSTSSSSNSVGLAVNNQPPLDPTANLNASYPGKTIRMEDLLTENLPNTLKKNEEEVSDGRRQSILDIATSLASSAALAKKMNEITLGLERNAGSLDKIFNFSKIALTPGVLPPVLVEGNVNYAQSNDDEVRISDKVYKIESPAKFVSNYPTWRNYLKLSFANVTLPNKAFDHKNAQEKAIWDEGIKSGWAMGERMAFSMFNNAYNRMERDFSGMILFRILQAQGLITPTIVAGANLGVTGGGKEMTINDQIFRITEHSSLNPDVNQWDVNYPVTFEEKDIHKNFKRK